MFTEKKHQNKQTERRWWNTVAVATAGSNTHELTSTTVTSLEASEYWRKAADYGTQKIEL